MLLITPSQCRAARALLNWSQPDLAGLCGVHVQTISAFEQETSTPTKRTLEKIGHAFEASDLEFLVQDGVRRRSQDVKTYSGKAGLGHFIWDVYETVKVLGGDVCVSNVNERIFDDNLEWGTDSIYMKKMAELKKEKDFYFKILVQEGDTYFTGTKYAEYRWIESKYFHKVPFYVYGNKLAIIHFKKDGPTAHVVENKDIADAQRVQFNVFWENANIPPQIHIGREKP